MIKKAAILTAGALLLLALLFGSRLVPYAQTAYDQIHTAVNDSVPIEFQLKAAEKQVKQIDGERNRMIYQIAKEQVAIENLEVQVSSQQNELDRQYAQIMKLRDHLESGDTQFVSSGRQYSNSNVKEDLANRFANYKVADSTVEKTGQILDARRQGLDAAKSKLDQMIADQQNLTLEIENLRARMHMLDIAKSSNNISVDDSHLSNTKEMINSIKARLDVEAEVLSLTPKYVGSIPMDGQTLESSDNILEDINAYFGDDGVVIK